MGFLVYDDSREVAVQDRALAHLYGVLEILREPAGTSSNMAPSSMPVPAVVKGLGAATRAT